MYNHYKLEKFDRKVFYLNRRLLSHTTFEMIINTNASLAVCENVQIFAILGHIIIPIPIWTDH